MLNDPWNAPFDQVDWIGFAIKRTAGRQFHVGILYKLNGKPVHLRHQCDHRLLVDAPPTDFAYLWINVSALGAINKRLIANKLSKAGGDKIPYGIGFKMNEQYLDKKTLKYCNTDPGNGLTCATYILAVLRTLGFDPFEYGEWHPTASDVGWQENSLSRKALQFPNDADHFSAEQTHVGGPRFRPEHVVGAGHPPSWPIAQAHADVLGAEVIGCYDQRRPPRIDF